MTPTHRTPTVLLALAALAAPALAADEYAAAASSGLHEDAPANAAVLIGTGQDDATREAALPFEFPFFGRLHTKVSVCSNGWLAFGTSTATASADAALPSAAAPNGIVAALWDDLTTGTGTVVTFTTGTAPSRTFVVAWKRVDTFSGQSDDDLSFQVRLREGTGVVEIAYAATGVWDGLSYAAGIEDPAGAVAFGAGSTANGRTARPASDWVFTPRAATVAGTILRDRPVAGATGLGPAVESGLPVAGIDLEVLRGDTGDVAARGRTALDGTYALTVLGADAGAAFALDLLASGEESRVVDGAGNVHRFRVAPSFVADPAAALGAFTLGAAADATNVGIRRAVNVQQAARRAFAWARGAAAAAVEGTSPAVAAETFPRLDFRYVPATAAVNGRTNWLPAAPPAPATVHVHDAADNPDGWDDDPVLRECGLHVYAAISSLTAALPARSWDAATNPQAALADGFATWFACAVQGRAQFVDTKSATVATVLDLEAATPAPRASKDTTGAVACSLWDLVDPANEARDGFAGTLADAGSAAQEVFRTFDRDLDAPPAAGAFDAESFFAAWRKTGPAADREATARVFIRHGAFADDAREPDDLAPEASSAGALLRVDGLTLQQFNEDRIAFAFSPAEPAVLTATVTQTGTSEFDVQVLDGAGAQVASGTNVADVSRTRVVAATPGPVAPGTYVVRVVWRSGAAASYSVALFAPLTDTSGALPAWTAGEPFKADLTAAGGVPPYAFATTASVPGLTVSNAGARLSGTPTAAGTYPVRIVVTDASGAGTSADRTVPLVVAPALAMPTLLGVPAGAGVLVDVGTGGTAAAWTAGPQTGGSLVLLGGPTLRLGAAGGGAAPSGAPRTFVAEGSAADAVGAVLAGGSSRVVVCPQVPATGAVDVPAGPAFGLWFDAIAGSRADLRFVFRGVGERPALLSVVDERGVAADLAGRVTARGRTVRLRGLPLAASGRRFVIFAQGASPFTGTVAVGGDVVPPREVHGVAVIATPTGVVDVEFAAVAGSRLRIVARAELVPRPVVPQVFGLADPDGSPVDLPAPRRLAGGRGVVVDGPRSLPQSGVHRLSLGGDGVRTGPVFWSVRIVAPRRAFAIFPRDAISPD